MTVDDQIDTGGVGGGFEANVPAAIHVDRASRSVSLEGANRVTGEGKLVQVVGLGNQRVVLAGNNLLANESIRDLSETPGAANTVEERNLRQLAVSDLVLLLGTTREQREAQQRVRAGKGTQQLLVLRATSDSTDVNTLLTTDNAAGHVRGLAVLLHKAIESLATVHATLDVHQGGTIRDSSVSGNRSRLHQGRASIEVDTDLGVVGLEDGHESLTEETVNRETVGTRGKSSKRGGVSCKSASRRVDNEALGETTNSEHLGIGHQRLQEQILAVEGSDSSRVAQKLHAVDEERQRHQQHSVNGISVGDSDREEHVVNTMDTSGIQIKIHVSRVGRGQLTGDRVKDIELGLVVVEVEAVLLNIGSGAIVELHLDIRSSLLVDVDSVGHLELIILFECEDFSVNK